MLNNNERRWVRLGWLAAVAFIGSAHAQDVLDANIQGETQINENAASSQDSVDALSEQREDLLSEYRLVVRQTESLRAYNEQLARVVDNQRLEMQSIEQQLQELENTNRDVVPLMLEMIDMLGQIVESDMPFLINERRDTVADLEDMIDRADVTTSEKYRRIMEAYQSELEFGRNSAHYTAELPGTGANVDFLKVGRTILAYQTLDGETTGWWNPATRQYEELGAEYRAAVAEGIRMAKNQAAPNLVHLPIPGPESAQ